MNRILDLLPQSEEAVVSRVLLLVHQSVDQHFPSAEKATRQYMKTVFSEEAVEKTAGARPDAEALLSTSSTVSANLKSEQNGGESWDHQIPNPPKGSGTPHHLPPPPGPKDINSAPREDKSPTPQNDPRPKSPPQRTSLKEPEEGGSNPQSSSKSRGKNSLGRREDREKSEKRQDVREIDWTTRITLALFLAGLLLLAYTLFT